MSEKKTQATLSTCPINTASRPLWKKAPWNVDFVLRGIAWNRKASCRLIAERFNRQYAEAGFSISKSYVATQLRQHGARISQLRQRWKTHPPAEGEKLHIWAMDLSTVTEPDQTQRLILGILDNGTRACIALSAIHKTASQKRTFQKSWRLITRQQLPTGLRKYTKRGKKRSVNQQGHHQANFSVL
jgi:hypothetical protein